MATTTIHKLAYHIVADTRDFSKGINATRKEIAAARQIFNETRTPVEKLSDAQQGLATLFRKGAIDATTYRRAMASLTAETSTATSVVGTLGSKFATMAGGIAATAISALSFRSAISGLREEALVVDQISKASRRTGISTGDLAAFSVGATLSDNDFKSITTTLTDFAKNLGQASLGMGRAKKGFEALGLDAKQLVDLPLVDSLGRVADKLNELSETKRIALASKIFGDGGGKEFLNFIEGGSRGIAQMRSEMERLGLAVSPELGRQMEEMNDAASRIGLASQGLKRSSLEFAENRLGATDTMNALAGTIGGRATGVGMPGFFQDFLFRRQLARRDRLNRITLLEADRQENVRRQLVQSTASRALLGQAAGGLAGGASAINQGLGQVSDAARGLVAMFGREVAAAAERPEVKEAVKRGQAFMFMESVKGLGRTGAALFRGTDRKLADGLAAIGKPTKAAGASAVIERGSREFFDLLAARQNDEIAKQQLDVLKGILRAVGLGDIVNLVPVEAI